MKEFKQVLLVEDNYSELCQVEDIIPDDKNNELTFSKETSLAGALDKIEQEDFHVILLDLNLPDSNGVSSVEKVQSACPHHPIIVLSRLDEEETAVSALDKGAQDYLLKEELTGSLLMRAINYALERYRVEAALRESEKCFRLMAENAQDLIYRLHLVPVFGFEYISPAIEQFVGYCPEDFYNDPHGLINKVHPDDYPSARAIFQGEVHFEQPFILRWIHRDGYVIWAEHKNVAVYDANGKIAAIEGIARNVNERVKVENYLRESRHQIQSLSTRLLQAYEQERNRLARELHDDIGQALTAVKLDLQMLNQKLESPLAGEPLSRSINMINDTITDVRKLVFNLRSPSLEEENSLKEMLQDMANEICARAEIKLEMNLAGLNQKLSWDVEIAIYRCIQEALTNVARHARAQNVLIDVGMQYETIEIAITDDGKGFDVNKVEKGSQHVGLNGMKERVSLVDGRFNITSELGKGTSIKIEMPFKKGGEL